MGFQEVELPSLLHFSKVFVVLTPVKLDTTSVAVAVSKETTVDKGVGKAVGMPILPLILLKERSR